MKSPRTSIESKSRRKTVDKPLEDVGELLPAADKADVASTRIDCVGVPVAVIEVVEASAVLA